MMIAKRLTLGLPRTLLANVMKRITRTTRRKPVQNPNPIFDGNMGLGRNIKNSISCIDCASGIDHTLCMESNS